MSPNGKQSISANIKPSDRISGNKFSGTYQVPIPLKSFHQPGLWTLTNLDIEDDAGNDLDIYRSGEWGTPVSDAERSIIGLRLGTPSRLSFNYNNSDYKPIAMKRKRLN